MSAKTIIPEDKFKILEIGITDSAGIVAGQKHLEVKYLFRNKVCTKHYGLQVVHETKIDHKNPLVVIDIKGDIAEDLRKEIEHEKRGEREDDAIKKILKSLNEKFAGKIFDLEEK